MEADLKESLFHKMRAFEENFETWIENQSYELDAQYQEHTKKIAESQERQVRVEDEKRTLEESLRALKLQSDEQAKENVRLESDLMTTRSKAKALPAQIDALKAKQSELSRELHQKVLAKEFEVEKQQKELAEVQQQIALYKNVLGLEFSTENGMLRCALRNVDPLKPDAQLSFIIHSGTDFVYRVYSCTPRVPFFDTLSAELEKTGSIVLFIHSMRKAFKTYLQTHY